MFRILLVAFLIINLTGCAAGAKKQTAQPSPTYEKLQEAYPYDYGDTLPSDTDKKPAKKTYSEPTIELSAKQIQQALRNAGFYKGAIDGKIGPKTKEAIKAFQKANNLKPDGLVGKRTAKKLNNYLP